MRVRAPGALVRALVQALVAAATQFGLDLTPGQTTALLSLSAVVLGLVARQRVSPR